MSIPECDFAKACEILRQNDNFNILIHAYPDGDTIGSGYALCKALRCIGKKANVVCSQEIPRSYNYLTDGYSDMEFTPETFVTADVADLHLLGGDYQKYEGKIPLCIDHHGSSHSFADFVIADSSYAANCEIIYELIKYLGVEFDRNIAECIYTGVSTDTGCFKYTNTTPQTHIIAAEMMKLGADAGSINRIMFDTKTRCRFEIERLITDSMEFGFDGRVAIICITDEMKKKTGAADGDLEGITSLPRQVEGVIIGITIRQKSKTEYKVSVRTHEPVDAASFCRHFGGGGHNRASGCTINGTLAEIKEQLLKLCREYLPD